MEPNELKKLEAYFYCLALEDRGLAQGHSKQIAGLTSTCPHLISTSQVRTIPLMLKVKQECYLFAGIALRKNQTQAY